MQNNISNSNRYNKNIPNMIDLLPTPIKQTSKTSFADKLKHSQSPKRDQAIILSPVQGIPVGDYIIALGSLLDPSKILFASRISNNRICVYLESKKVAEELIANHKFIKVNSHNIPIRSFITPSHRLIVWAFPSLPNNIIVSKLKELDVKPLSEMHYLSAGVQHEKLKHVLSFRRHIFIHQDHPTIPETLEILHEDEKYRVFISLDESRCPICKKFGHDTDNCKILIETNLQNLSTTKNNQISPKENKNDTFPSNHATILPAHNALELPQLEADPKNGKTDKPESQKRGIYQTLPVIPNLKLLLTKKELFILFRTQSNTLKQLY